LTKAWSRNFDKKAFTRETADVIMGLVVYKNPFLCGFLLSVLVGSGLILLSTLPVGPVHASIDVTGVLNTDTTWTKANSPFNLTGPTAVGNGVTLTIEPGVTVNLGTYYLQVNGTLRAQGSSGDKIVFTSEDTSDISQIVFTSESTSWNEQAGSGCIIENAVINASISITSVSPKISNNFIRDITASMTDSNVGIAISGGSPVISGNHIIGGVTVSGSAVISDNIITGGMGIYSGSPVISNNNISGGSSYFYIGRDWERDYDVVAIGSSSPVISGNNITGNSRGIGFYETAQSNAVIFNNRIFDCGAGIYLKAGDLSSLIIQGNVLLNNSQGIDAYTSVLQPIERNLIINNTNGIEIYPSTQLTIRSNTIANNSVGISTSSLLTTIVQNNIQDNSNYNIYLESYATSDVNATYNWWGTTDTQAINQTIHDKKNDFNLGIVNFAPFLTALNPEATPDPTAPTPTPAPAPLPSQSPSPSPSPSATASPTPSPSPSQSPTATPEQSSTQTWLSDVAIVVIIVLVVVIASLLIIIAFLFRKKR
jgi:parallel beta-helix repeat protein